MSKENAVNLTGRGQNSARPLGRGTAGPGAGGPDRARVCAAVLVAALPLALPGCGDMISSALGPDREPTELRLSAPKDLILEGDSALLQVTVLDQRGEPFEDLPVWVSPQWSSSDASVAEARDGTVLGLRAGDARIRAEVAGLADEVSVRVDPEVITLDVSALYLVQSVQRLDASVPLVAGRDALVRVFLTGNSTRSDFSPAVVVRLHQEGEVIGTFHVPSADLPLLLRPGEGSLGASRNVRIPGELLQPGVGLTVEVDPEGELEKTPESVTHFPGDGLPLALDIRPLPELRLRFVPVRQAAAGVTGSIHPSNAEVYLDLFRRAFPVAGVDFDIRQSYETQHVASTTDGWGAILRELQAVRVADGSSRYYYGVVRRIGGAFGGFGFIGQPVAVGYDRMDTNHGARAPWASVLFAHELGHNFGRRHAPCGNAGGIDPGYPNAGAETGVYGFDTGPERLTRPEERDLMSYCYEWISDYTYEGVLAFREAEAQAAAAPPPPARTSLLVWGEVRPDGLLLEPAFRLETAPTLPGEPGPYTLEGRDAQGAPLFFFSFEGAEVAHGEPGVRQFAFAVPLSAGEMEGLELLRLTGPTGTAERRRPAGWEGGPDPRAEVADPELAWTVPSLGRMRLDWDAGDYPAALVRDRESGRVRAILRGGRGELEEALPGSLEILLSDGVGSVRVPPVFR